MAFSTNLRATEKVADVIGLPAALMLVSWYGGRKLYVPTTTDDTKHLILKIVGAEAFAALVANHPGEYLDIPVLDMDSLKTAGLVYRLTAKGISSEDLAQLCGVSPRTVHSIRKTLRLEGYPQIADLLPADEVTQ